MYVPKHPSSSLSLNILTKATSHNQLPASSLTPALPQAQPFRLFAPDGYAA